MVYVKAGIEPSKASDSDVNVIAYYSYDNQIQQMCSAGYRVRKTIKEHPEYFESPFNIPSSSNNLSSSSYGIKRYTYNPAASTSKYIVYSGTLSNSKTINLALSKDGKQLVVWTSGNENNRKTYILTDLSKFDPASQSSQSYDFLE